MKTRLLILSALMVAFIFSANAQFTIDAQYRVRAQALHGYKAPAKVDAEAAFHVGQRTRLNLNYKAEKYETKLSLQDVRTWGDADIVNATGVQGKSGNNIDIYEAWFKLKFDDKRSLKIGRQELKYDDQRLISWRNWWDRGMTYDAATFSCVNKDAGLSWDLSVSYNSNSSATTFGNDYLSLDTSGVGYFGTVNPMITQNFLYIKKKIGDKLYVSATAIASGWQKAGTSSTIYVTGTEGIHINYNATKKAVDGPFAKVNLFVQNGHSAAGKEVNANMITAQLGYRTMDKKLEVSAGVEMLSGTDASDTTQAYADVDHNFNLLNGGRHPYYEGYLDWFVLPKSTKYGGLMTINFNVQYKLSKKDIVKLGVANVNLATNVFKELDDNGDNVYYGKALTNNVDLTYIRKINKDVKLMVGASYGMPTEDLLQMKGMADADGNYVSGQNYFVYTMLIVTPKFFDSSKK